MNELKQTSIQFGLGGIAGGVGVSAVYPIDLVKTNIQESRVPISILKCVRNVYRQSGVTGFFSGLRPQLLGVAPEKAIKLAVNDLVKRTYKQYPSIAQKYELPADIVAGGLAGASQVIFTNPLEIVKIRLQIQSSKNVANRTSAMSIARGLGIRGLYGGSKACFLRDVPFSMIYFPMYSRIKDALSDDMGNNTGLQMFTSGIISGSVAAVVTTPADVVKTRLQAFHSPFNSISECFNSTYRQEGVKGLFRGTIPRVLRSAPQFAVTLYVYEMLQSHLQQND
jgi:solute carrier family 25 aspartate/glutamate transporter 12/13